MLSTIMNNIGTTFKESSNTKAVEYIDRFLTETLSLLDHDTKIQSLDKIEMIADLMKIRSQFQEYLENVETGYRGLKYIIELVIEYKDKYETILMMIDGFVYVLPVLHFLASLLMSGLLF